MGSALAPGRAVLGALGWDEGWERVLAEAARDLTPARVVRHDGVAVLVASADGERALPLRRSLETLVVGDWVALLGDRVVARLPRRSLLRRREAGGDGAQAMAANVEQVLLACGLDRPVRVGRVRRGLAMAEDCGARPIVVFTKTDLCEDVEAIERSVRAEAPGVAILTTSARGGAGLAMLAEALVGFTSVWVGESGAGKSTLVNALVDADVARVGEVREGDRKGRHTTTARRLHLLPRGGVLIDAPGVREAGLVADDDAVGRAFDDVEALGDGCRFGDCGHTNEPGCAVQVALRRGLLSVDRLAAWGALRVEAASTRGLRGHVSRERAPRSGRAPRSKTRR